MSELKLRPPKAESPRLKPRSPCALFAGLKAHASTGDRRAFAHPRRWRACALNQTEKLCSAHVVNASAATRDENKRAGLKPAPTMLLLGRGCESRSRLLRPSRGENSAAEPRLPCALFAGLKAHASTGNRRAFAHPRGCRASALIQLLRIHEDGAGLCPSPRSSVGLAECKGAGGKPALRWS